MLNEFSAESLLEQLRQLDECQRIEAKRGSDIGGSVMQSVCAFANEPGLGGGYLLLGISEPDEQHEQFYVSGVSNTDQLLGALQANCREQFEQIIPIETQAVSVEGQTVIVVFVPELDPVAKPCTFKGRFDSKNKRKTGVWRRGLNGDVDNAGLRAITALDTLSASQVLKPLHHHYRLLEQGGAGSATYYRLTDTNMAENDLPLFAANDSNTGDLITNTSELPADLQKKLGALTPKAGKHKMWPLIVWLCALRSYSAKQLATLLNGRQVKTLKSAHLNPLREQEGLIDYTHPEVINHPEQAYQVTAKGLNWLKQQGICVDD